MVEINELIVKILLLQLFRYQSCVHWTEYSRMAEKVTRHRK